jgi:hypothetical protein
MSSDRDSHWESTSGKTNPKVNYMYLYVYHINENVFHVYLHSSCILSMVSELVVLKA